VVQDTVYRSIRTPRRSSGVRQIANVIEQSLVRPLLRTGDPLPPKWIWLAIRVNRSTIRESIRDLETHGLLFGSRGEKRLRVRARTAAA